jgi:hypothetical protein
MKIDYIYHNYNYFHSDKTQVIEHKILTGASIIGKNHQILLCFQLQHKNALLLTPRDLLSMIFIATFSPVKE